MEMRRVEYMQYAAHGLPVVVGGEGGRGMTSCESE